MQGKKINLVSVSGGKDSTATLLLAIERGVENLQAVFADTGNEHPLTYEYVDYLEVATGVKIHRVQADFTKRIAAKRRFIANDQRRSRDKHGRKIRYSNKAKRLALSIMKPTGIPYLDMCIWKTRFPASTSQFCTHELKIQPIEDQVVWPLLNQGFDIESWQGIRWDESKRRSAYVEREGIEPDATRVFAYRPILGWTADEVFAFHRKHGIKHNPLYELGMGRVGCMPCINARKDEIREISVRFPEVIDRIREWEAMVSVASKWRSSTFFAAVNDPTVIATDHINYETHGIDRIVDWSMTERGGRRVGLFSDEPRKKCSSIYGLCE